MILSFNDIGKVPREVLKTSGFALGFQQFPWDLQNVNEWKIMFDPSIITHVTPYYLTSQKALLMLLLNMFC